MVIGGKSSYIIAMLLWIEDLEIQFVGFVGTLSLLQRMEERCQCYSPSATKWNGGRMSLSEIQKLTLPK
jgi:hypothetical protein